ncbi:MULTISPECIES: OmpA family protein [Helicobacter]|uniref:Peptidoglycan-associated lipoprotein n=1 Tax=Helicobacter colisuis TaxID=2949739 RepID=A0ABT0TSF0_9HELI|nr:MULTISPECIES: OmpA family protein [Helicobacter]MCI7047004.1 OmpA family protein [Helicobacter sp.]MCL9818714.1 OmpA family protein [Helicobacter colisuis]MCL9820259.1 OmpA family protein [Helicobacter colisuis]MCL9822283.1 OmpA family protein [Helicobacter colisuis]RAX53495.1 peptidoglycan-associated lipoprotein [Helicobacter sp. 11-8110]
MKKSLVFGSLLAALLMVGCSQKSSNVDTSNTQDSVAEQSISQGFVSGRDNFVNLEERIQYVEGGLQNIFFDFDQFVIRGDMQSAVDNDANVLKDISAAPLNVRVEGNTDEWGTDEYNYALGLKRAVAVKDALVSKGVSESKIVLVSYGESKPTCTEKTRECWAENRKVTFKMLP